MKKYLRWSLDLLNKLFLGGRAKQPSQFVGAECCFHCVASLEHVQWRQMQICTHLLVCAIWCTEHRWEESQKSQPWMMDWLRLHKAREQINKAQTNKVNVEEYIYYFFMKYRALSEKRVLRTPRSRFQLRYLWIIFLKPRETHQSSSTCRLNSLAGRKVKSKVLALVLFSSPISVNWTPNE